MTEMTDKMRAFIAVELPDVVVNDLRRAMSLIRDAGVHNLRTVRPEGIHLTVKFLGDIAISQVEPLSVAMNNATRDIKPFELHLGGTGAFPNNQHPRVIWAGVDGEMESLRSLQQSIEKAVEGLGVEGERREYNPHLTLGRIRGGASQEEGQKVAQTLSITNLDESLRIPVNSISLMRSTLTPNGAVYDRLASASLGA
jgi:2'-5' RNA ligase